ncbi:proline dehydrogenase family protein [Alicyclobacillus sp. SO9]|uniref:proline dehydrogenase family protein n=1 Tax=Alicyclobacillus sp. SO9 TaxID=2665646 RepID=UPI0018E7CEF7|nr:proline dehydrogenase family protein [Alicyclobacillus sp. SO9]QQE79074.1 proline dehydrogenase family protein [Alicyclobacillus sp. SO9]
MEQALRNMLLFMAKNRTANNLAKKYGLRFGAHRFVAGMSIPDAMSFTKSLNKDGLAVTLDHLGESVFTKEEAAESTNYCLRTLDTIKDEGVNSRLSVKLTQLGLDIDKEFCLDNVRQIAAKAHSYNNFVRIDMEDYDHNEVTLDIFNKVHAEFPESIGLVIQSYLYKSEADVKTLGQHGVSLRMVKGAYKEPASVAFPEKKDVDDNLVKLMQNHLLSGCFTAMATHDEAIIETMKQFIAQHSIPKEQYEFQMLYGIRTQLQLQLVQQGYPVRVYVPFGNDWYAYFMRRLAERPANVGFVLRSMVNS